MSHRRLELVLAVWAGVSEFVSVEFVASAFVGYVVAESSDGSGEFVWGEAATVGEVAGFADPVDVGDPEVSGEDGGGGCGGDEFVEEEVGYVGRDGGAGAGSTVLNVHFFSLSEGWLPWGRRVLGWRGSRTSRGVWSFPW